MAELTVITKLLKAVSSWSYAGDDRPHLQVVLFDKQNMVATDGHRIVCVPLDKSIGAFALHRDDIAAIAAAQREFKHQHEISIAVDVSRATVRISPGVTMIVKAYPAEEFPPYEMVFPKKKETPVPGDFGFNAKYLSAMDEVIRAAGRTQEDPVRIKAWSKIDGDGFSGPMLFESDQSGIRFAIMAVRGKRT